MKNSKHLLRQSGLTLVELMIALALGLLISLVAVGTLNIGQQGFRSVDAASQLRENSRFATELIRRLILQSGYLSSEFAISKRHNFNIESDTEPNIKGFNNAKYSQSLAIGTSNSPSSNTINNSDLLIIRFQTSKISQNINGNSDYGMINCAGHSEKTVPINSQDRTISVFHIQESKGEPSLMCTWRNEETGSWSTEPLIHGVESLQFLYGVYDIVPNTAPSSLPENTVSPAPQRYLRADQLTVTGNATATNANWSRVRSIRVGMILRGPLGSAQEKNIPAQYAFGPESSFNHSSDGGTILAAQTDGRLRQSVNFTVHLRNSQGLQ
ncbi:MAG: PilW family protein [Comamonas sp.]